MKSKRLIAYGVIAVLVIATMSVFTVSVFAQTGEPSDGDDHDDHEVPITGEALDKASAAALDYIGEGRVTETEVGDEEGYYEVEITLDDGSQVDVHLDEAFNVLGHEADGVDDD